jgi:hypothetical protein
MEGRKQLDWKALMKISVQNKHITAVTPPSLASYCPVALAIQDCVPEICKPTFVGCNGIELYRMGDPKRYRAPTPKVVQDFLVQFDAGIDPQPFEFELALPWL